MRNADRCFGLGEKFTRFEKTGTRATIWQADTCGSNTTDMSYKAVPVRLLHRRVGADAAFLLPLLLGAGLVLLRHRRAAGGRRKAGPVPHPGPHPQRAGDRLHRAHRAPADAAALGLRAVDEPRRLPQPRRRCWKWPTACAPKKSPATCSTSTRPGWSAAITTRSAWRCATSTGTRAAWGEPEALFQDICRAGLWHLPVDQPLLLRRLARSMPRPKSSGYLVKNPSGGICPPGIRPGGRDHRLHQPGGQSLVAGETGRPAAKRRGGLQSRFWRPGARKRPVCQRQERARDAQPVSSTSMPRPSMKPSSRSTAQGVVWRRPGYIGSQRYPGCWAGDTQVTWEGMAGRAARRALGWLSPANPFGATISAGLSARSPPKSCISAGCSLACSRRFARFHGTTPREPWHYRRARAGGRPATTPACATPDALPAGLRAGERRERAAAAAPDGAGIPRRAAHRRHRRPVHARPGPAGGAGLPARRAHARDLPAQRPVVDLRPPRAAPSRGPGFHEVDAPLERMPLLRPRRGGRSRATNSRPSTSKAPRPQNGCWISTPATAAAAWSSANPASPSTSTTTAKAAPVTWTSRPRRSPWLCA